MTPLNMFLFASTIKILMFKQNIFGLFIIKKIMIVNNNNSLLH